jgi:hypothetical protein
MPALQSLGKVAVDLASDRNALLFLESSNRALCFRTHYPVNTPVVETSPRKRCLDRSGAVVLWSMRIIRVVALALILIVVAPVISVIRVVAIVPSIPSVPGISVEGEPRSKKATTKKTSATEKASASAKTATEATAMEATSMEATSTKGPTMAAAASASSTPVSLCIWAQPNQSDRNKAGKEKVQLHVIIASTPVSSFYRPVAINSMPGRPGPVQ